MVQMENEYFVQIIGQITYSMVTLDKTNDVTGFILYDAVMNIKMLLSETDACCDRARVDQQI